MKRRTAISNQLLVISLMLSVFLLLPLTDHCPLITDNSAYASSDVTFAWDAVADADLAGYRLYRSATAGQYSKDAKVCDVAKPPTQCTVAGILDGTWYFVATAYDQKGNESGYSNEISTILDTTPPGSPKNLKQVSVKISVNLKNGQPVMTIVATTGN